MRSASGGEEARFSKTPRRGVSVGSREGGRGEGRTEGVVDAVTVGFEGLV